MGKKTFVLHDDSVNTYGFRLLTAGGNLDEFRRNPVMFYRHNDYELPIGRWEDIRVENSQILADAVFDEEDEQALKIKGKVDRDFLRMASIGTWAPEEVSEDPALRLPGQTGYTVTKWTLREASIVPIGANHNALRMFSRKTGEQIDLTDCKTVLQLMDALLPKKIDMENLKTILNLSDNASNADVEAAVQTLKQEKETLQQEKETLQTQNSALEQENTQLKNSAAQAEQQRLAAQKTEAAQLVDAAVRDGRLDATGKDAFLALFDADFEKAKTTLDAIPRRQSVAGSITQQPDAALADMATKSWEELDKAGLLPRLKDEAYDLYCQKFEQAFNRKLK